MSKFTLVVVREVEPYSETDCGLCPAAITEYDDTDRCEAFASELKETGFDFAAGHRTLARLPACVAYEKKLAALAQTKHIPFVHTVVNGISGHICLGCGESLTAAQVKTSEEKNDHPLCNEVE